MCGTCSVFQSRWWPVMQTKTLLSHRYVRLAQYLWLSTEFIRHWKRPVQRSDWFPLTIHSHMIHICSISSPSWVQTRPSWTTSSWLAASLVNSTTEAPFIWWTSTILLNCSTPLVQTDQLATAHKQSLKRKRGKAGQTVTRRTSI